MNDVQRSGAELVFAWIHVSDIHFEQGSSNWKYDQQLVLRELLKDIANPISQGAPRPDVILCTGDVAATGDSQESTEYGKARTWLESLAQATGATRSYFVPGNHDVQRTPPKPNAPVRLLSCIRDAREEIDEAYKDVADNHVLQARFANYTTFVADMAAPSSNDPGGAWCELLPDCPIPIRLIGLNTSVVSNDDFDREKLRIGLGQLAATFGDIPFAEDAVTIVLGHHPFEWLAEKDRDRLDSYLFREADVYMHGHIHSAGSRKATSGTGDELITISAGAIHGDPPENAATTHGYSLCGIFIDNDEALRLRIWPRSWSMKTKRFVLAADSVPEGKQCAEHDLRARRPPTPPAPKVPTSGPSPPSQLMALAARRLAAWGARRTAFPTDMSISELANRALLIPTPMTDASGARVDISQLAAAVTAESGNTNLLLLGAPGAGKSVIMYELTHHLLQRGQPAIAVGPEAFAHEASSAIAELRAAGDSAAKPILIFDGIDEALSTSSTAESLATQMIELAREFTVIASSRVLEYDMEFASVVPSDLFGAIVRVKPWTETEFDLFVRQLAAQDLLRNPSQLAEAMDDPALRELTHRPLFARMLTYVANETGRLPETTVSLYQQYLSGLGSATTLSLSGISTTESGEASRLWRELAWYVFQQPAIQPDAIPLDLIVAHLRSERGTTYRDFRAVAGIVDVAPLTSPPLGAFVHYSFYEFLVAQHATFELTSAFAEDDLTRAVRTLSKDFPQEIRRHLTALLRATTAHLDANAWPAWLARVYRAAPADEVERRVVRNLIAYIACRLDVSANSALRELLEDEIDPFLQNSLLWALTRVDDREALVRYLSQLDADPVLASLNRGYLLYYFGDIRSLVPPFSDDPPYVDWQHTRDVLRRNFEDRARYSGTPPSRKAIDVYTFLDLADVRDAPLDEREADLVAEVRRSLVLLPHEALQILDAKIVEAGDR